MQIADLLVDILACAEAAVQPPVCRSFINPGDNAPFDVCTKNNGADGQLWVGHLGSQPGWPQTVAMPINCATVWNEQIEIGIVRCAAKIGDRGEPPCAEDVTADALQQERDRMTIRNAMACCWGVDSKDIIVQGWEPISPEGGCVGGVWTVYIRDSGCDCGHWGS